MEKVAPAADPPPYWIAMAGGTLRMLFPTAFAKMEAGTGRTAAAIFAAGLLLLLLVAALVAFR
jgi:hypothetical protein